MSRGQRPQRRQPNQIQDFVQPSTHAWSHHIASSRSLHPPERRSKSELVGRMGLVAVGELDRRSEEATNVATTFSSPPAVDGPPSSLPKGGGSTQPGHQRSTCCSPSGAGSY